MIFQVPNTKMISDEKQRNTSVIKKIPFEGIHEENKTVFESTKTIYKVSERDGIPIEQFNCVNPVNYRPNKTRSGN